MQNTLPDRRRFARFIVASGLTNLADGIAVLAWAWVASLLTRDALWIASVPMALRLPWFIFAIPAGIVTDRVDRRRLILAADTLRVLAFSLAALMLWLALPLPPAPTEGLAQRGLFAGLMLAALVVGVAEVFRDTAAQTMLPALVPHALLERANGRLWAVELIGNQLLGPALAALLLGWYLAGPFVVNAAAIALAVWLLSGVTGQFRARNPAALADWRAELSEGFSFLRDAPMLRLFAWVTGFWNLTFEMAMIALILHVQEHLGLGALAYGLVLAGGAVGGILGSLMAETIVGRTGPGRAMQWSLVLTAPFYVALALAPGPVTLGLVLGVSEFWGFVWNTVSVSFRQRAVPDALRGRVNSLYRMLAWGMMPLGMLMSGLTMRLGQGVVGREAALALPIWLAALIMAVVSLVAWRKLGSGFAQQG
ncbi:MAG: MFS transporter [Pseudorhodobacter sp.]|nr:MFS transporter [Pseudorhodobacter sp.]